MPRFYVTIDWDPLTLGLKHVVYRDCQTDEVLGGWDIVGKEDDEILAIIEEYREKLEKRLYHRRSTSK